MDLGKVADSHGFLNSKGVRFDEDLLFLEPVKELCYLGGVEFNFLHCVLTHQVASNDDVQFCLGNGPPDCILLNKIHTA